MLEKKEDRALRIGITDTMGSEMKFERYLEWIRQQDPTVELDILSYLRANAELVKTLDGLVLTGGGDVHPGYYGKEKDIGSASEVDEQRDQYEFEVIGHALDADLPILGICRGMQVMNVCLGGSLILDLASSGYEDHAAKDGKDVEHIVAVDAQSMLGAITGAGELTVNSSHHQAVGNLGSGLMVSATSPDGVIEAAEWILKDRMPFLMLVQWHPERMTDPESPASKSIIKRFLQEIHYSRNTKAPSSRITST